MIAGRKDTSNALTYGLSKLGMMARETEGAHFSILPLKHLADTLLLYDVSSSCCTPLLAHPTPVILTSSPDEVPDMYLRHSAHLTSFFTHG